jgi:hypothetical protein
VGLFAAPEKHIFEHTKRIHPICFQFPFQRVDEVNIQLPAGWKVASVPKEINQDSPAVQYMLKIDGSGNSVSFRRMVRSDLLVVGADKYGALRNFYQFVRTGDDQQIVLQPSAVAAAN